MRDDAPRHGPHDRPAPQELINVEAEQAVLGLLMVKSKEIFSLPEGFSDEHFHDPSHARIFRLIREQIGEGASTSVMSLSVYFPGMMIDDDEAIRDGLKATSWAAYLSVLAQMSVTAFGGVRRYAEIVMRLAEMRGVFWAAEDAQFTLTAAAPQGLGAEQAAAPLMEHLLTVGASRSKTSFSLHEAFAAGIKAADAARTGEGMISTGFDDLDRLLGGWAPARLTIAAGRPGMGKTALALAFGLNVAAKGAGVMLVSLEMTAAQLGQRMLSAVAARDGLALPYASLSRGSFSDAELDAAYEAGQASKGWNLNILENIRSVGEIMIAAQRQKQAWAARGIPFGLIIVDYLQLLEPPRNRGSNRVNEVTDISIALKHMALRLGVNVLALSQLSRAVEGRDDKRPILSDLRESGSIEQDADSVLLLLREEYYLDKASEGEKDTPAWAIKKQETENTISVHVAKNRHGQEGEVRLYCDIARNHFTNFARSDMRGGDHGQF